MTDVVVPVTHRLPGPVSVSVGAIEEGSPRRAVWVEFDDEGSGSVLPSTASAAMVHGAELIHPRLMPTPLEFGVQENRQGSDRGGDLGHPLTEARDVGVVMPADHLGVLGVSDHTSPDTGYLVRGHAHPLTATAYEHSSIDRARSDEPADGGAEVRVVDALVGVGAHVHYLVTVLDQVIDQRRLQVEAGVVGTDSDRTCHIQDPFDVCLQARP